MTMADRFADPQHHRPQYLAGQVRTLTVVVASLVKHGNDSRDAIELLKAIHDQGDREVKAGSSPYLDYHEGMKSGAAQILERI